MTSPPPQAWAPTALGECQLNSSRSLTAGHSALAAGTARAPSAGGRDRECCGTYPVVRNGRGQVPDRRESAHPSAGLLCRTTATDPATAAARLTALAQARQAPTRRSRVSGHVPRDRSSLTDFVALWRWQNRVRIRLRVGDEFLWSRWNRLVVLEHLKLVIGAP
jgi:hypothetical protein